MKVNHQRLEDVPPDGLEGAGRRPATYFAPAVRATADELAADLNAITSHPILGGLLQSVSGLLAVLNDKRQIISVNTNFLQALGINDINDILALRPGEAVGCIHAYEPPNGCGTTRFCATCGAAIAIVTSLAKNLPVEETCALTVGRGGKPVEMCLSVRAQPVTIDNRRLLLLFLLDITKEHFLQSLERIFFHDVNNILNGIMGYCQLYCQSHDHPPEIEKVSELANRLCQTVALQRALSSCGESKLTPQWQTIASEQVVSEVMAVFVHHPAAAGKSLVADNRASGQTIGSDITLLLRVLCNMVTNALEASPPQGSGAADGGGDAQGWLEFFGLEPDGDPGAGTAAHLSAALQHQGGAGPGFWHLLHEALRRAIPGGRGLLFQQRDRGHHLPAGAVRRQRTTEAEDGRQRSRLWARIGRTTASGRLGSLTTSAGCRSTASGWRGSTPSTGGYLP